MASQRPCPCRNHGPWARISLRSLRYTWTPPKSWSCIGVDGEILSPTLLLYESTLILYAPCVRCSAWCRAGSMGRGGQLHLPHLWFSDPLTSSLCLIFISFCLCCMLTPGYSTFVVYSHGSTQPVRVDLSPGHQIGTRHHRIHTGR